MRFSIALPTDRVNRPLEFVTGDAVMEIAAAIETAGLDACFVTDHPAPDAKWLGAVVRDGSRIGDRRTVGERGLGCACA